MKIYTTDEITKKLNWKNKIKKIKNIIFSSIFIVSFICICFLLVNKVLKPNQVPNLFGYKSFIIVSGSMEPYLKVGDLIVVKDIDIDKISKGDIISFWEGETLVTHRVEEVLKENGEKSFKTKGDNNNKIDESLVTISNIEGICKFKIPKVGKIILYSQNIWGGIIIFGIIYIIYIVSDEKEKRKISRHEKRKEYGKLEKK